MTRRRFAATFLPLLGLLALGANAAMALPRFDFVFTGQPGYLRIGQRR